MPRVIKTNGATQQSEPTIAAKALAQLLGCGLHEV
jgi:hypothetical protein